MSVDFNVRDNRRWTFSLQDVLLGIMDILARSDGLKLTMNLSGMDYLWIIIMIFLSVFGLSFERHVRKLDILMKKKHLQEVCIYCSLLLMPLKMTRWYPNNSRHILFATEERNT